MKTPDEIQKIIDENLAWLSKEENRYLPKRKTVLRENANLKELKKYLLTSPNESFVKSERDRLSNIIKSKESNYDYWLEMVCPLSVPEKKRKALFQKENNLPELKRYLKNIKLILS